ncbi:hypothetical protein H0H92_011626, partial [Tricholoma furcatifolium]
MSNLSTVHPLQTQENSQRIYNEASELGTAVGMEQILKQYSLRAVENAFWTVQGTDLHCALSYDTLHFDDNGLWEDHFFKVFKFIITFWEDIVRIDSAFDTMLRWRGLNHFDSVMNITFND